MIFALREGLQSLLDTWGFPVTVVLGPERPAVGGPERQRHRVVLERDTQSGDRVGPPIALRDNGARVFVRMVGHVARVYASCPEPGAFAPEHEKELDRIVDGLIVALRDWCASPAGRTVLNVVSGRLMTPEELAVAEVPTGAGYELRFQVGRSVDQRKYDGTWRPTATLHDVTTTTRASRDGVTFEPVPPDPPADPED